MPPEQGPAEPHAPDHDDLRARVAQLEQQVAELRVKVDGKHVERRAFPPPLVGAAAPTTTPPTFASIDGIPSPPAGTPMQRTDDSLESRLGSQVLSKIAIVLLLVGAAWFLKWAFDNRWIGPAGRVAAGLLAGIGIVLWSERFRRNGMASFSYALKAVGSGILYLSLWASFQLYHQIPGTLGLLLMLGVTAWNATLALTQNSRVLAAYALLGAYLTPVLLSTGGDHEVFLMLYLTGIAAAVAVVLHFRPWNLLILAPVPASAAYFIGWALMNYGPAAFTRTILLLLLLWAVLALTPVFARTTALQQEEGAASAPLQTGHAAALVTVLHPLVTALFGSISVYCLLFDERRSAQPWAALAFAVAYLALSFVRRGSTLALLHLTLAITFITTAIPLKATGHGITLGWLAEALALLWIARAASIDRRSRTALEWLAVLAMVLGFCGAVLAPWLLFDRGVTPFWNREFATGLAAILVLGASSVFWARTPRDVRSPNPELAAGLAFVLLNITLALTLRRELLLALHGDVVDFAYSGVLATQGALMLALGFWKRMALARWIGLLLFAITLIKTAAYDMRHLGAGYRVVSFLVLGVLLMAASFAYQKDWLALPHADEAEDPAA